MSIWLFLVIVVLALSVWLARSLGRTAKLNQDQTQNILAEQLIAAASVELIVERADAIGKIEDAIYEANLTSGELTTRMAHACSMIKSTGNVALYERSKRICDGIVQTWPERYSNNVRNQS